MNYLKSVTTTVDLIGEPLTVAEAKDWMRVKNFTDDDIIISELIKSARIYLEGYTSKAFGPKTMEVVYDVRWCMPVELPYGPVDEITTVHRRLSDGTYELLDADDYSLVGETLSLPSVGVFKIVYDLGYSVLPLDLKTDLKTLVASQYQNRGIQFTQDTQSTTQWRPLNADKYKKIERC